MCIRERAEGSILEQYVCFSNAGKKESMHCASCTTKQKVKLLKSHATSKCGLATSKKVVYL